MSDERTIQTTMWIMIGLQTIGSVDLPGHGERKMPAPRAYVAIIVLWTILGMFAGTGYSRPAAALSKLLVLTGIFVGPFGKRAVDFLNTVATNFGVTNTQVGSALSQVPGSAPQFPTSGAPQASSIPTPRRYNI